MPAMQAKVYVESGENNPEKLEDISWIKDVSDSECFSTVTMMPSSTDHNLFPSLVTAKLIFCTSIFFNILILIFTVLYLDKVFTWIEQPQHKHLKDLYKASAIVFIFINLSTFLSDVLWHIDDSITLLDIYSHYVVHTDQDSISLTSFHYGTYLIMKVLFVFLVFTVDITVSCFSTCKHSHAYTRCSKVMHALALCQILWLVHRLATDTVLFIIAFVVAPAQALGMVTLLLSTVVCTVLFVSSLIKKCQGCRCTKYYLCNKNALSIILCTFLIATCTVGLIFTVTLLFIALVDNGLQSAGIGGFILSLVPPTAIFVIGLCINREFAVNFYHNVLTSSSTARPVTVRELEESTPTNEDVIIQPDEYTQLVQTSDSVAIDMEAHEKFEEKPYRPAQKIGL